MEKIVRLFAVCGVLCVMPDGAKAWQEQPVRLEEAIAAAERIIVAECTTGTVLEPSSTTTRSNELVTMFDTLQNLKGSMTPHFSVRTVEFERAPRFKAGDRVILFFTTDAPDGSLRLIKWSQHIYHIHRDPYSGKPVVAVNERSIPVEQFVESIRRLMAGSP